MFYVNRNMVGAVVGVQPFGGCGLSGRDPKPGVPTTCYGLLQNKPVASTARQSAETPGLLAM